MDKGSRGLFVVLYGVEGVGKTRQLDLLEDKMEEMGVPYKKISYPLLNLDPTGSKLKKALWDTKNPLPEEQMQELFAQNRRDFQPTLKSWLDSGVCVIAENYKGTGIAWGLTRGVPQARLDELGMDQIDPDIGIVIDGPIRDDAPEGTIYENEQENYQLRKMFNILADKYGWVRVGGDAPMLTVAGRIWAIVRPALMASR